MRNELGVRQRVVRNTEGKGRCRREGLQRWWDGKWKEKRKRGAAGVDSVGLGRGVKMDEGGVGGCERSRGQALGQVEG